MEQKDLSENSENCLAIDVITHSKPGQKSWRARSGSGLSFLRKRRGKRKDFTPTVEE